MEREWRGNGEGMERDVVVMDYDLIVQGIARMMSFSEWMAKVRQTITF